MEDTESKQSRELWAVEADDEQRYGRGFHWVESRVVSEYMNSNISGNPGLNWVAYSVGKYLAGQPSPRILSLGCGGGALERDLLRLKPDARLVGIDFSPGAIEIAKTRAAASGLQIDYRVDDMNEIEIQPQGYDFVFASSCLHHVTRMEHIVDQIRGALQPPGLLICNEYVGPNQLQWTSAQVQEINEILAILPDCYRRRVSDAAQYKRVFLGPSPLSHMNEHDPSEAIRSEEIIPLIRREFQLLEYKPFGGTILHMLLQDIIGNFDQANASDTCILQLICHVEKKLIGCGALKSDFVFFVAKPRL